MTDARVYRCDDVSCFFNHGQACSAAQIDLDFSHECIIYIERGLAEEAMLEHIKGESKKEYYEHDVIINAFPNIILHRKGDLIEL